MGHGGVGLALGGHITTLRLYWFGGGYIDPTYDSDLAETLITLGGVTVEALSAATVIALSKDRLVRACGAALIAHACWYLSAGTWMGFGDGALLYTQLHEARTAICVPAGIAAIAAAYLGGRHCAGTIVAAVPSRAHAAIACVAALVVNAVPAVVEPRLRADPEYVAAMATAPERRFPAHLVLTALVFAAGLAGMLRSPPRPRWVISDRRLRVAAAVAAASLAAVIAIDSLAR